MTELGLDRFDVAALALATGADKAGIYRQWPNTELLLGKALRGFATRCRRRRTPDPFR